MKGSSKFGGVMRGSSKWLVKERGIDETGRIQGTGNAL